MISPHRAQQIILSRTPILSSQKVYFLDSLGRTLAQDIKATNALPPFDRTSMDGYALRSIDTKDARPQKGVPLRVIGTIQAGGKSEKRINRGEAIKIMTGGMIPWGADSVVIKEHTRHKKDQLMVFNEMRPAENIRFRGDDVKKGEIIIKKGAPVTSGAVGLLASLGICQVKVYRKPKVGILVTGDELLDVQEKLQPGKIRSSNQFALFSQVKEAGGEPFLLGIARDKKQDIARKIRRGLEFDALLISGGVSVGDFDLVPEVLRRLAVKIFFHKVSIQPGRPLIFGKKDKTPIFGLPGNPVSTMVSFYTFVRPCLVKMSGRTDVYLRRGYAVLDEPISVHGRRTKILRGVVFSRKDDLYVRLSSHQGSGNILSLAKANCLLEIPQAIERLTKGQKVEIQYLP